MVTQKVIKIGNSFGVIIHLNLLKSVNLKVGDEVDIEVIKGTNTIVGAGSPNS